MPRGLGARAATPVEKNAAAARRTDQPVAATGVTQAKGTPTDRAHGENDPAARAERNGSIASLGSYSFLLMAVVL